MHHGEHDHDDGPPRRVLIPLDANEALLALSRFAYSAEHGADRDPAAPPHGADAEPR